MSRKGEADRGFISWRPDPRYPENVLLCERILTVVNSYKEAGLPSPTIRDVYYDLRGRYGYPKSDAQYRKTTRFLRLMRRAGMIDFDDVDDDTATVEYGGGGADESPLEWAESLVRRARIYDRDWSEGQTFDVVVLTEGAGKVRQFSTVAEDYGVEVRSGGGWESVDYKHKLARSACLEYMSTNRPTVYLHCGDYDADGVALYESGVEDVCAFAQGLLGRFGLRAVKAADILIFKRLMLTEEQIAEHVPQQNLDYIDPAKIKASDHRGRAWYEDMSARGIRPFKCELEALDLATRLEIVKSALDEHVDLDALTTVKERAQSERKVLVDAVQRFAGELAEVLKDDEDGEP